MEDTYLFKSHRATRLALLGVVGAIGATFLFLGGAIGLNSAPYTFDGAPAAPLG